MIHLLKSSTLTFIAVVLGISMVYDFIGQPALGKQKKDIKQVNQAIDYALVHVTGGCYDKGDTFGDGSSDERPVRTVCVDDFDIGKYEVTQGQWLAIMKKSPSTFGKCGEDCPVEEVSWDDVQAFILKLNTMTGRNYRLPTGDEWEYAARSGGKHEKWSGTSNDQELGDYAWYNGNSGNSAHPVGQKKPNGLGIYDMSGNVWEWVQDIYKRTAYPADSTGNRMITGSVTRGGGWKSNPKDLRASNRFYGHPGHRYSNQGFRLARTR
jgi:formylglycine-generating enzyme required for sulfatase activity